MMLFLCACGRKAENISEDLENALNNITQVPTLQPIEIGTEEENKDKDIVTNQQEDKSEDELAPNGFFRVVHMKTVDAFGGESAGPEVIAAIAEATNNYSNNTYEVWLYYNYEGESAKDKNYFYFYVPYKGGVMNVWTVDYKIGNEVDKFSVHEHNYVYEDVDSKIYEFLKQRFIEGEDISFSVCDANFVFTIHGEGFADLIYDMEISTQENIPTSTTETVPVETFSPEEPNIPEETIFKWNEPQSILYGMVGVEFQNDPSFTLGQYGFLATASVKDVDTLMTLISGDLSNRGFDNLIPFIQHTMKNGQHTYQDGIHLYFNEDWSTGSNHYAVVYEKDGQVTVALYSDKLEGITHYFKGKIE